MFSLALFEPVSITPNQLYELGNLVGLFLFVVGVGLWGFVSVSSVIRGVAEVYGDKEGECFGPKDLHAPVLKLTASMTLIGMILHTHWIWRTLHGGNHLTAEWLDRPIDSFADLVLAVTAGSSDMIAQMVQILMAIGVGVLIAAIAYILNITPASHAWFASTRNRLLERRANAAQTEAVSES
ncbi:hypothetical protein BKG75_17190 [Mycobacteroides chelonae]|nr:hypothetical protein BKG75_17190 [Mycobacteroides chelonae]